MTDGPREEVNATSQVLPDWGRVTAEPLCAGHTGRRPVSGLPHTPPAALTVCVSSKWARFPGAPGYGDSATVVVGGFPENRQTGDPALEAVDHTVVQAQCPVVQAGSPSPGSLAWTLPPLMACLICRSTTARTE